MKDAMSHAVETGNSDDKYYSSSMTQPITNDKILDKRPLELSSAKLIESKAEISRYE